MSKIPAWFNQNEYQKDFTPNEWAFEIFIRLKSKDKAEFIITNHPHSDSFEKNILFLLSEALEGFSVDDATKIINDNKDLLFEKFYQESTQNYKSGIFDELDREVANKKALMACLRMYKDIRYLDLLANFPLHLNLDEQQKKYIEGRFIESHENLQAYPLIFSRNNPRSTKESYEFYEKNKIAHGTLNLREEQKTFYRLSPKDEVTHENLMIKQPEACMENRQYGNSSPFFRPNFAFSDKEILEAVERHLKQHRPQETLGKDKALKQLSNWKEYQILALWDLTEWCNWTGKTLTQAELAAAMWPYEKRPQHNEVDYVERIRKVSKKYMIDAITERNYLLLLTSNLTPAE